MTSKMKAAVYYGVRDIRVETIDIPEIEKNDILLKVKACGICGSDVHSYNAGLYVKPGQIMGHEFVAEVAKVGKDVQDIHVGQRGIGFHVGICGACFWCKSEQYMLCPSLFKASTGYGYPGAFAEYVKIPNAVAGVSFQIVPDEIDDLTSATIEPVSVAAYAVDACAPKPGQSAVVLGAGLIGNAAMQILKASGVKVVVTEVSKKRMELAKQLGADAVIDAAKEDVLARVKEIIGVGEYHFHEGAMADMLIECSGASSAIETSFELVRSGGSMAFVGLAEKKASIDITKIVHKTPKITGCLGGDIAKSMALLGHGTVQIKPLISHVFDLKDAKHAFEVQLNANVSVKVIITMV